MRSAALITLALAGCSAPPTLTATLEQATAPTPLPEAIPIHGGVMVYNTDALVWTDLVTGATEVIYPTASPHLIPAPDGTLMDLTAQRGFEHDGWISVRYTSRRLLAVDVNGDGTIDSDDYFGFLAAFFPDGYDYDGDGSIDSDDYFRWASDWNAAAGSARVISDYRERQAALNRRSGARGIHAQARCSQSEGIRQGGRHDFWPDPAARRGYASTRREQRVKGAPMRRSDAKPGTEVVIKALRRPAMLRLDNRIKRIRFTGRPARIIERQRGWMTPSESTLTPPTCIPEGHPFVADAYDVVALEMLDTKHTGEVVYAHLDECVAIQP